MPVITGDRSLIEHLFQNLISNAYKYNNKNKKNLKVSYSQSDFDHILTFEDNGNGIPSDQFTQIFLPFKRLVSSDDIEGTGVGLAICKTVVEQHSGNLTVQSELGKGSVFTVTLPKLEIGENV